MAILRKKSPKKSVPIPPEDLKTHMVAASRKNSVKTSNMLTRTQKGLVERIFSVAPERFRFETEEETLVNVGWWAECNLNLNQLAGVMGLTVTELLELMQENPDVEKAYVTGRERGSALLYRAVYDMAIAGSAEGVLLYLRLHQGTSRGPQNVPNNPDRSALRTVPGVFVGFSGEDGANVVEAEG